MRCWCTIVGISVGDDYENIDHLLAKNVIDKELAQNIKKLNGMRNAVVHRYGAVDVELIFENIEAIEQYGHSIPRIRVCKDHIS